MSIQSPAKQERIERHLMRQRGAGARTVSATFGFSFGSSAPTSTEHTPTSLEPPPKRRKTLLRNGICVEDDTANQIEPNIIKVANSVQQKKPRKRWVPPVDLESTSRSHAKDNDDNFIRLGVKRVKKTADTKEYEQPIDPHVTLPVTKGRPSRRAVAEAAVKVAGDLVEESLPVDEKRQAAEAEPNSKKTNKSRKRLDGPIEVLPVPLETIDASHLGSRSKKQRKDLKEKAKSTLQKATEEMPSPERHESREPVIQSEIPPSKPKETAARKRKADGALIKPAEADKSTGVHTKKSTKTVDENENVAPASCPDFDTSTTKSNTKAHGRSAAIQESSTKRAQESLRAPLKESDVNVTLRSTSPEKPRANGSGATSKRGKTTGSSEPEKEPDLERTRPAKRRKLQVRRDEDFPESLSKAATAAWRDKQVGNAVLISPIDDQTKRAKQKEQHKRPAPAQEASAEEEDIDWLFQSQDVKRQPALLRKQPLPTRMGPRTPKRLADIDLDDLLSNIASFAKMESQACDGSGPISKSKAAETTNRSKKRGKR